MSESGVRRGKVGNAGGGKGPQFKTNARRSEGPGDWVTYQLRIVFRKCRRRCTESEGRSRLSLLRPIRQDQPRGYPGPRLCTPMPSNRYVQPTATASHSDYQSDTRHSRRLSTGIAPACVDPSDWPETASLIGSRNTPFTPSLPRAHPTFPHRTPRHNPHRARGTASAPLTAISCLGAFRTPGAWIGSAFRAE